MGEAKRIKKLNAVIDWELISKDLDSLLDFDACNLYCSGCPAFDHVLC